jgi:hypothetical protein
LVIIHELVHEKARPVVARFFDAELIHPVTKRVWMKIQDPRRALWTIHHSIGMPVAATATGIRIEGKDHCIPASALTPTPDQAICER